MHFLANSHSWAFPSLLPGFLQPEPVLPLLRVWLAERAAGLILRPRAHRHGAGDLLSTSLPATTHPLSSI